MASTLVAVRIPNELLKAVDGRGKRSKVILEALEKLLGSIPAPAALPRNADSPLGKESLDEILDDMRIYVASGKPIKSPERFTAGHDPKTCRLYGCLMCKAAKES